MKIKIFCFPHAGGSSLAYENWQKFLNRNVEMKPIELAGRGKRFGEPLYASLEQAVDDALSILEKEIEKCEYALFGHSMGASIAYELALKIKALGIKGPLHLFLSGKGAPNVKDEVDRRYHLLDDTSLKKKLLELGGTSPDFFNYPDLWEMFMPLIRNDLRLASVKFEDRIVDPFSCQLTILVGKNEDLSTAQICGWKEHTSSTCCVYYFNGGHFFLLENEKEVVKIINDKLIYF